MVLTSSLSRTMLAGVGVLWSWSISWRAILFIDRSLRGGTKGSHGAMNDPHFFYGHFQMTCEFVEIGNATEFIFQLGKGLFPLADHLDHIRGDMNRLDGFEKGSLNGLFDPPGGIRRKTNVHLGIESLDRLEQADVPFLDEVLQG